MTDLTKCPRCNGEADNGFDRCLPPSPYVCTRCTDEDLLRGALAWCIGALSELGADADYPRSILDDYIKRRKLRGME